MVRRRVASLSHTPFGYPTTRARSRPPSRLPCLALFASTPRQWLRSADVGSRNPESACRRRHQDEVPIPANHLVDIADPILDPKPFPGRGSPDIGDRASFVAPVQSSCECVCSPDGEGRPLHDLRMRRQREDGEDRNHEHGNCADGEPRHTGRPRPASPAEAHVRLRAGLTLHLARAEQSLHRLGWKAPIHRRSSVQSHGNSGSWKPAGPSWRSWWL